MSDIHNYIQFRALEEGQGFSLTVAWFENYIAQGVRVFFQCTVDEQGNVLSDAKSPACLQRFWFEKFLALREPISG